MEEFLMKPKVDFAFKEIMTDKKARTGFLASVLKINPEDIKETQILNTNLRKEHKDDKQGILDVWLLMNDDAEIDIEIHLSQLKVWAERSLFYLSKMYADQISPGQSYGVFKKCINISIKQNSIPVFTSVRTHVTLSILTKWSSIFWSFQNCQKSLGKTAVT